MFKKTKKDPQGSDARHDKKSGTAENMEDLALKERVAGHEDARQIKRIAEKIDKNS